MIKDITWHKYPEEKPSDDYALKAYLVRTLELNSISNKKKYVYRVCSWCNWNDLHGWFYNGNELWIQELEWLELTNLE